MTQADCAALIMAAGSGERFGGEVPKQYRLLAGTPVLRRTVETFLGHPAVDRVRVVINPAHRDLCRAALRNLPVGEPTRARTATDNADDRPTLEPNATVEVT